MATETQEFPVGGPRQAVYDALAVRGFHMGGFGDKHWIRRDLHVHIYGAGSRLVAKRNDIHIVADGPMAEVLALIDGLKGIATESPLG